MIILTPDDPRPFARLGFVADEVNDDPTRARRWWQESLSNGQDGTDGQDGSDGAAGLSCWDLDGDGIGDPSEDINEDGDFDAEDCQGPPGPPGEDGLSCWDLDETVAAMN